MLLLKLVQDIQAYALHQVLPLWNPRFAAWKVASCRRRVKSWLKDPTSSRIRQVAQALLRVWEIWNCSFESSSLPGKGLSAGFVALPSQL